MSSSSCTPLGTARISLPDGTTPSIESLTDAAKNGIPTNKDILAVARGDKLKELAARLKEVYEAGKEEAERQRKIAEKEEELRVLKLPRLLNTDGTTNSGDDQKDEDVEDAAVYKVKVTGDIEPDAEGESVKMTPSELVAWLTDIANDIMNGELIISQHSEIIIEPQQVEKQ
jgi:hypothetical protein